MLAHLKIQGPKAVSPKPAILPPQLAGPKARQLVGQAEHRGDAEGARHGEGWKEGEEGRGEEGVALTLVKC